MKALTVLTLMTVALSLFTTIKMAPKKANYESGIAALMIHNGHNIAPALKRKPAVLARN